MTPLSPCFMYMYDRVAQSATPMSSVWGSFFVTPPHMSILVTQLMPKSGTLSY